MKTLPLFAATVARRRTAFTLIELLTVMAIILVLAGLIINIAGSANYNSAKSRAKGEIAAMSTALESYKADNGAYPSDPAASPGNPNGGSQPTTEVLDPHNVPSGLSSTYAQPANYVNASEYLYQALAGYQWTPGANGGAMTLVASKSYFNFKPGQLHAAANAPSGTTASSSSPYMYVVDPFGFSYGYSTINAATVAYNNAQTPPVTTPVTVGYNPTFDLWSTAGYASGGKSLPSSTPTGSPSAVMSALWITNW